MNDTRDIDLVTTLGRGIRTPLRALRAALEDLKAGHSKADDVLPGALDTLAGVMQHLDALEDHLVPSPLLPLVCTTREIARSARDLLGTDSSKLLLAHEGRPLSLFVDGPLMAKSLARVAASGLDQGGSALLHVRTGEHECSFTVVVRAADESSALAAQRCAERLGLEVAIAARDLARLGAEPSFQIDPNGVARLEVVITDEASGKAAA